MKACRSAVVLACLVVAGRAHAQAADDQGASDQAPRAELQDIVVTAQHRAERLQDVPISISAVSGASLASSAIRSSDEFAVAIPGITIKRQTGASLIFLRGIGTAGGQAAQEGAVATFVDGVYQPSPSSSTMSLNNIARIEVLKGPQGTLYGRNATGGAINIITLTPSKNTAVRGQVGYGNKDTLEGNFYGTTGLGEHAAIDVAAYYRNQRDGFGTNLVSGKDINKGKDFNVRSKLLVEIGEDTKVTLGGDYSYYFGSEGLAQRQRNGSILIDGVTKFPGGFYDATLDVDPTIRFRGYGGSGTIDHDFGDIKLTSITAYRNLSVDTHTDPDGSAVRIQDALLYEKNRQFSQEVRLGGSSPGVDWLVGGYYLKGRAGYDPFRVDGLGIAAAFGGLDSLKINKSFQTTRSLAAFGQVTVEVATGTRVTGGIRYTSDKRSYHAELTAGGTPLGGAYIALAPANAFDTHKTFSKPSWRLSVDHKFAPDVMGYVSYNRGFKSGIYNVTDPGSAPVEPELLDAYETGLKTTLLGNRLHLDTSVFYYDYKNIQLTSLEGPIQRLLNAAKAKIYGAEVDFDGRVAEGLSIRGGVAYTHGRYGDFPAAPYFTQLTAPPFGNIVTARQGRGNKTVFTPTFTANVALDYTVPVGDSEVSANVSYAYNGGFYFTADNSVRQPAYSIVNSQLVWNGPDQRYNVRLWARNLFDKKYFASGYQSLTGSTVVAASGRTFGASVGFSY